MTLMMNRVKKQSGGVAFANLDKTGNTDNGMDVPTVDNAGKFSKSSPVSLNGDFGVMPLKKKLNVEIK